MKLNANAERFLRSTCEWVDAPPEKKQEALAKANRDLALLSDEEKKEMQGWLRVHMRKNYSPFDDPPEEHESFA
jgi:hypothetical protein